MKRWILFFAALWLTVGALADRVKNTTVACPTVKELETLENMDGSFRDKNMYILKHGCVVLTPKDKIHVLAPDDTCCGLYYRIQIDATNDIMYVKKFSVYVEQSTGNVFKF
jgi:hypothetical protein